jgi:dihydroorotase
MAALRKAGCIGVSNGLRPMASTLVQRRALEYASTFDMTVFLHANDHALAHNGCAHEGQVATRLGLPGIPEAAETAAVARDLALIEQTGVRAHFCRLITADVAIPYLYLSENDIGEFDSLCHLIPPLRTVEDCQQLRDAVQRGTLSAICSDHQPHEPDAKSGPFPSTEPGASGLETLLPLSIQFAEKQGLALPELVDRLTCGPASILGLPYGTLSTGASADICIFDPQLTWVVDTHTLVSHGHNTPFLGWEMQGRVTHTLLEGRMVYSLNG